MDRFFLDRKRCLLLIIDIQERLAQVMDKREQIITNILHLLELSKLFDIPVMVTEQYPKGIGKTVQPIVEGLPQYEPIEKITFDCCLLEPFTARIAGLKKDQIIIVGMETHICVLQTVLSLLKSGYTVHVVSDGVCSRAEHNWKIGLEIMRDAGAVVSSTEIVLFQLLRQAGTEEFKHISKRIK